MICRYLFVVCCLYFLPHTAAAQLSGRLVNHTGFVYEFTRADPLPANIIANLYDFYTLQIGTYYTLLHTENDVASLGIDPSLHFGFNFFNTGTNVAFDITTQVPVLLLGRYGALSSPFNSQRFGIGGGIGFKYTYLSKGVGINQRTGEVVKERASFVSPMAAAEITFPFQGQLITLRGLFSIATVLSSLRSDLAGSIETEFDTFGIGILYGF